MMFFFKKKKHKHKKNGGKCFNASNCLKGGKKRFGLTQPEMDDLLLQMMVKPKIPIESVN
jgi:hypothetical protein